MSSQQFTPTVLLARAGTAPRPSPLPDGWDIVCVPSVADTLDRLEADAVDCVVSTQHLDDGTGLELLASVRERSSVPFVLWPTSGGVATASRAVALGADGYVPQRVETEEDVREAVERAVREGTATDTGDGDSVAADPEVADATAADAAPATDAAPTRDPGTPGERGSEAARQAGGWGETVDRWETIAEAVDDVIWTVDRTGQVTYVNATGDQVYDLPQETVVGNPIDDVLDGIEWTDPAAGAALSAGIAALLDGERDRVRERVTLVTEGSEVTLDVSVVPLESDEGVVGAAGVNRDVSDQQRHAERIAALHTTARELLDAETRDEVAETTVAAAETVLDLGVVVVYLHDPEENELAPVAHGGDTERLYGSLPQVAPGDGPVGKTFLNDETAVYADLTDADDLTVDPGPIRSGLLVPLNEHGVVVVGDTAVDAFDDAAIERAELLAANAEATLDRTRREDRLAERERTLAEQNRRLDRLEDVNDAILRVLGAVVRGDTREEMERAVCERLAAADRFALAWIGTAADGTLEPRTVAGTGSDYLTRMTENGSTTGEPAARAAAEREPVVVRDVAANPTSPWRREALGQDFGSVVGLPLEYDRVDYGVLAVYTADAGVFDERTVTVLEELATTVAHAINAVEQQSALLSDHRFECEFSVDGADDDLTAVADALGGTVTVRNATPRDDGRYNVVGTVPADVADRVADLPGTVPAVHEAEVVAGGSPTQVRVVVEDPSVWERVSAAAGRPEAITVTGDGSPTVRVSLPASTELGEYADRLAASFEDVTLVARRQHAVSAAEGVGAAVDLTERQREVLEAAYHSGFFDWPRASTGEEVAAALDIAQPTFLDHLRTSERKLVAAFLDPPDGA